MLQPRESVGISQIHRWAGEALTAGEEVGIQYDVWGPAGALEQGVPEQLDGVALEPNQQSADADDDVHRDDDEPHDAPHPSLGQTQERDAEGGLGPGEGHVMEGGAHQDGKRHL